MAKRKGADKAEDAGLDAGTAPTLKENEQPLPEQTPEVVVPPVKAELMSLVDHPDYQLQPGVRGKVLYRGDTLDLAKLRPSQFERLTTNADAGNIVRRK